MGPAEWTTTRETPFVLPKGEFETGAILPMIKLLLWLLLLVACWPLALLALVLYPFIWLLMLPFRLVGIAVDGVFNLLLAIVRLPARILGQRP